MEEGHIVFGADPSGVSVASFLHYLLNQLMDFDQTCIDTLLGRWKNCLDFDDLDLIFKVTIL